MIIKDAIGTHKVIEQSNGISVKILKEPSPEYKKKMLKASEKSKEKMLEKKKIMDQEKLISAKMREMAIEALKSEGKI